MVVNQGCKQCRERFAEDSPERNYENYKQFCFKTEESFCKHNSRNKNCPCKKIDVHQNIPQENHQDQNENHENIAKWKPPMKTNDLILINSEEDLTKINELEKKERAESIRADNLETVQKKIKTHKTLGGRKLWYEEQKEASNEIFEELIKKKEIQWIHLVAEPGSGKTMVVHCTIYNIYKLPYDNYISPSCITVTTGMSDKEWQDQIIDNFTLNSDYGREYIWNNIINIGDNDCIVHRSNLHKRITYLLDHQEYLTNHIFIIDESHFADDIDMTIDKEFNRLGLTKERMKEYNIKIIFISATPDVNLSILNKLDNHKLIRLKNGRHYKGFKYHYDNGRIHDDNISKENTLEKKIRSSYNSPRYHYIRVRTQQGNGECREEIKQCCKRNHWNIIEDDSSNNNYLSFYDDFNQKEAESSGKTIIKTYEKPSKHTFIFIKNKYQASKRLKITPYTGIIYEKSSKKRNTTVTCNGLIPRFFGYDIWPEFENNEQPLFICDKKSIEEYKKFSEDFIYKGKDYTGNKIKSDKNKTKESKNTLYGSIANSIHSTTDNEIYIDGPFEPDKDIQTYLLEERGFRSANITVKDSTCGNKDAHGYMYPKRNVDGHTCNKPGNSFLTEVVYKDKFANKSPGSFINRRPKTGGKGQSFMIYPVYKNTDSEPDDYKYYVHSLIVDT